MRAEDNLMGKFSEKIGRFGNKAQENALTVFQMSVLEIFGRVSRRTPVDSGRLRGNWQIDINRTPTGTTEVTDANNTKFTRELSGKSERLEIGDRAVMANNLPYALPIERGSSTQAPRGMVAVTAMEFTRIVKQIARKVNR
jgi:hypothetical protein